MKNTKKNISFETTILKNDYRVLVMFNIFLKNKLKFILLLIGFIAALTILILSLLGEYKTDSFVIYSCIIYIILIAVMFIVAEMMVKQYVETDKLLIKDKIEICINKESITFCDNIEDEKISFDLNNLYEGFELKKYFFLFINSQQAILLPKRNMNNKDIEFTSSLIFERIGKRFKKRNI